MLFLLEKKSEKINLSSHFISESRSKNHDFNDISNNPTSIDNSYKPKIGNNTNVCHLSYVGDCEIGQHVNIGAGTITANYEPLSKVKSKTILEDNVKIGSNSVLVAPVRIKEGANIENIYNKCQEVTELIDKESNFDF